MFLGLWLCTGDINRSAQRFCVQWTQRSEDSRWTRTHVFWWKCGISCLYLSIVILCANLVVQYSQKPIIHFHDKSLNQDLPPLVKTFPDENIFIFWIYTILRTFDRQLEDESTSWTSPHNNVISNVEYFFISMVQTECLYQDQQPTSP